MKKTGFREMLRDRLPETVDLALKWCKAKEKWLDLCYSENIWIYVSKKERYSATRSILGLSTNRRSFDFDRTIMWPNLSKEEAAYWKRVSSWVSWFRTTIDAIEETYTSSKRRNLSEMEIKVKIINYYLRTLLPKEEDPDDVKQRKYNYVDKLVNYIIKYLEKNV